MILMKGKLKIVPYSKFDPIIVLLLAKFRSLRSDQGHTFQPELPVLDPCVKEFRGNRKALVVEIHDGCDGGGEVEDIEGLFLADPEVKIIFHGVNPSIVAFGDTRCLLQQGIVPLR